MIVLQTSYNYKLGAKVTLMKCLRILWIVSVFNLISCSPDIGRNLEENPKMYDHEKLSQTQHMLEWLHPEPISEIKNTFLNYIEEKVSGSQMVSLSVTSEPQWLTGGKPQAEDESNIILTRTGVAFLFSLKVKPPEASEEVVSGVFTWVGVQLDDPPNTKQRNWINVGGTLEDYGAEGALKVRIYERDII